jgi:hypothetical protein
MDGALDPQGNVASKDKLGNNNQDSLAIGGLNSYERDPENRATHKSALFKLDFILLPTITLIYFLNFLDR